MAGCYSKVAPHDPTIQSDNQTIKHVIDCTLLGVVINEKLNWQNHIDKVCKKASSKLFYFLVEKNRNAKSGHHQSVHVTS